MAKTVTVTPAPAAVVLAVPVTTMDATVSYSDGSGATAPSFTSLEIENFSATEWLRVEPAGVASLDYIWIPPGGSKALAVSAPLFYGTGDIAVYDAFEGSNAPPGTPFGVQVTLLKGS